MPKEMINVTVQRKQGEPWGMVIVGGKDQALTVKLGRIKVISISIMKCINIYINLIYIQNKAWLNPIICRLTAQLKQLD